MSETKRTFFCVVVEPGSPVKVEFLQPGETDKFRAIESNVLPGKLRDVDLNYSGARFKFEGTSQESILTATLVRDEEATRENAERLRGKMQEFLKKTITPPQNG